MEDTAEAYVGRMLKNGYDWMGILSVSRCARGGKWRKESERILKELGKMPTDKDVISKAYRDEFNKRSAAEVAMLKKKKADKKSPRTALTRTHQ